MMKIALFVAILALGTNAQDFECENCKQFIQGTADILRTPEEITGVGELLKLFACTNPAITDSDGCMAGVDNWYGKIAEALFGLEDFGGKFCSMVGQCPAENKMARLLRQEDACDRCREGYVQLSDFMKSEVGINAMTDALNGEVFCSSGSADIPDVATCQEYITLFIPIAAPVLGDGIVEDYAAFCNALYGNICEA